MEEAILTDLKQKITEALASLRSDLVTVRTGRANPSLVENLSVEVYGTKMPLSQLGAISAPDPKLLVIQTWDPGAVGAIANSILQSNIGLTPAVDGTLIRLPIPPMTQERREQLVKLVSTKLEHARIAVRQIRQDALKTIAQEVPSEDQQKRLEKAVQQEVDKVVDEIAAMGRRKEEELREI